MNPNELLFMVKDTIIPHDMSVGEIETLELKNQKQEPLLDFNSVKMKKDGREVEMSVNLGNPVRIIEKSRYLKSKAQFPFCNWNMVRLSFTK